MSKLWLGIIYGILGQIVTFISNQGSYKFDILKNNIWIPILLGIPTAFFYLKSVHYFIDYFGGEIWPSRIIGFVIGIIVFTIMGATMFKETLSTKTTVLLLLCFSIVGIQVMWKTN